MQRKCANSFLFCGLNTVATMIRFNLSLWRTTLTTMLSKYDKSARKDVRNDIKAFRQSKSTTWCTHLWLFTVGASRIPLT